MRHPRHKAPTPARMQSGMSLLELLCLLAILAVLATIAVPMLRGPGERIGLENAAREIVREAMTARARAIADGRLAHMDVDLERRTVHAAHINGAVSLPPDVEIEARAARLPDTDRRTARFLFYPNGQSTGGTLTLRRADAAMRIDINWVTGQASYDRAP